MNAEKRISDEHAKWFDERLNSFLQRDRIEWQPEENYLQWNALFITFTFDKRKIHSRKSVLNDSSGTNAMSLSPEFDNVDRLYKKMCRALLGSNYHRKRTEQPLMIATADVNGTRYGRPSAVENLHVHSLWVFRKDQIERFKSKLEEVRNDPSDKFDFDQIHVSGVEHMSVTDTGSTFLSSYMAKFLGLNATNLLFAQDIAIYPTGGATG